VLKPAPLVVLLRGKVIESRSGRHWIGEKKGGNVCLLQGFFFGAKIISAMIRHIFSRVERSFTFGDHALSRNWRRGDDFHSMYGALKI